MTLACAFAAVAVAAPGCSMSQQASSILCQPSQRVRCNDCPTTGTCAGTVCEGWQVCSTDGTAFVGGCQECAPTAPPPSLDDCESLATCCTLVPSAESAACNAQVVAGDQMACFALLNQYLVDRLCGGSGVVLPSRDAGFDAACVHGGCGEADASPVVDATSKLDATLDALSSADASGLEAGTDDAAPPPDAPTPHDDASTDASRMAGSTPPTTPRASLLASCASSTATAAASRATSSTCATEVRRREGHAVATTKSAATGRIPCIISAHERAPRDSR